MFDIEGMVAVSATDGSQNDRTFAGRGDEIIHSTSTTAESLTKGIHLKSKIKGTLSPNSVPNSPKNPADSLHKLKGKINKRSTRSGAECSSSSQTKNNKKLTFKDQQMNRLVFQEGGLPDGSEVFYISHGMVRVLKGYKWGRGIFCCCCNTTISPSQFEAHAGQASRKKPYDNIYISNGVSLHEYASLLKLKNGHMSKKNDDLCGVCKEGGELWLCHGCPRSFHKGCVFERSETSTSEGKWFCKYCRNSMKCLLQNSGEQIAKRNIRIVYNPEKCHLVACAICRAYDFSTVGFNDRTVLVCDQCEREYHIGCLREHKNMDLKELPCGDWFCTRDCRILHSVLEKLVASGPENIPDHLMGSVRRISKGSSNANGISNSDVKWIVVRGKDFPDENPVLLTQAVDIFHACFNPIIDSTTGSDFIPSMAYGQIMGDSDFTGVHCAMLTIDSEVVTAGMFRVFGADVAELPIVATSEPYQGQGYFQLFFKCFEKLLGYLKIKKMLVPAAENVKSMWVDKFDFEKVTPRQLSEYRQTFTSMVAFQGTCLLEKEVPQGGITYKNGVDFSLLYGE
ncbi:hypothetical protein LXL04_005084 [Taraxacum kok-saghyz]